MRTPRSLSAPVLSFVVLACAITWLLAAPLAWSWLSRTTPPPYAVAGAGLSAFGPLFAALAVGGHQKRLREVFGRWRTRPAWIVVALFTPMAIHLVATALSVAVGATPAAWLHPPVTAEHVAALVVFSVGEEFGWRGFAYPRLVDRHGLVRGSLLLGFVWGIWHLMYSITPEAGRFEPLLLLLNVAQLPLYSLLIAWVFERANRSMAVALAFHAGGHLDNLGRAPLTDVRLHAAHLVVLGAVAWFAARKLSVRRAAPSSTPSCSASPRGP